MRSKEGGTKLHRTLIVRIQHLTLIEKKASFESGYIIINKLAEILK